MIKFGKIAAMSILLAVQATAIYAGQTTSPTDASKGVSLKSTPPAAKAASTKTVSVKSQSDKAKAAPAKSANSISAGAAKTGAGVTKKATLPSHKRVVVSRGNPDRGKVGVAKTPLQVSIPATVSADGKPIWLDVKAAQLAARAKRKLILADISTQWCHWCKVMEKKTFHDPEVEKYLAANFVCMKVDAEDGRDGQDLAQRCQVSGFPTIVVFKSNGKPIGLFEGYKDPETFMAAIKQIPTAGPQ